MDNVVYAEVTETGEMPGAWPGGLSLRLVRASTDDDRRLSYVLVAGEGLGYTDTMVPCRLDGSREPARLADCDRDVLEGLLHRHEYLYDSEAFYVHPLGPGRGVFPWTKKLMRTLFRALREEEALRELSDPGSDLARALALSAEEERLLEGREERAARAAMKGKTASEKIVALLCERGEATATKAGLARELGCAEKTVARSLRELRAAGVVEARKNRAPGGGSLANTYALAPGVPESVGEVTCFLSCAPAAIEDIAEGCDMPARAVRGALRLMQHKGDAELIRVRTGLRGTGSKDIYRLTAS